jgi:L-2-hydroxyglutarate oxidase
MAGAEIVVVGGGIVGLATAYALVVGRPARSVLVLEAEDRLAAHQSGHNSGVIHSGLYYRPGSLKARTCRVGREALYRFCDEAGIPYRRSGKLVVATRQVELLALAGLEERGRANGLQGLRRLAAAEVQEMEPAVTGVAGLWVPETGVVDFARVVDALAARVRQAGAEVLTGARVHEIRRNGSGLMIGTAAGEFRAALLVNCAGLQADRLARLSGADPGVVIVPFRGEYYELVPARRALVRTVIFPVPDPAVPFLGVHFTRTIADRVEAGPNAVLAWGREGYRRWDVSVRDLAGTLSYGGFWKMARAHWRVGLTELGRSYSKRLFVRALQRLVPEVRAADLVPGGSGVRAQAVDAAGRLLDDFHIVEAPAVIHVLNAPSPAATAALAVGREVAARALRQLGG